MDLAFTSGLTDVNLPVNGSIAKQVDSVFTTGWTVEDTKASSRRTSVKGMEFL